MQSYGSLKSEDGQMFPFVNKINLIGRANQCSITLKHPSVSKEHAIIEFDGKGNAVLKDLESLNGIFINNQRVTKGSNRPLQDLDVIQFGKDVNRFQFVSNQTAVSQYQDKSQLRSKSGYGGNSKDFKISVADYVMKEPVGNTNKVQNGNYRSSFTSQPQQQQSNLNMTQVQIQAQQQEENLRRQIEDQSKQQDEDSRLLEKMEQMKQELSENNQKLSEQMMQKEEEILKVKNGAQQWISENNLLREENNKMKAKLHALELYCSEQQKRIDRLNDDSLESRKMLEEVFKQDWGKKLHQNQLELGNLRTVLVQKDEELDYYRKQLAAHFSACKDYSHNFNNHLQFVEQQTKQLQICKKQIQEYENRQNTCQKKWTNLLQENIEKEERIKGLKIQLDRQLENFQNTYTEMDKKLNDYNMQILKFMENGDNQQFEAAQFLVEQMKQIQEEKKGIYVENENLHVQIQELIAEVERMKNDLSHFENLFDTTLHDVSTTTNTTNFLPKLKTRCEELEDLINELKQKGGVGRSVDMAELLEQLEKQIQLQKQRNDELVQKMKEQKGVSGAEQNCIEFFAKVIDEKDRKISYLQKDIEERSKEIKNLKADIESLNYKLDNGYSKPLGEIDYNLQIQKQQKQQQFSKSSQNINNQYDETYSKFNGYGMNLSDNARNNQNYGNNNNIMNQGKDKEKEQDEEDFQVKLAKRIQEIQAMDQKKQSESNIEDKFKRGNNEENGTPNGQEKSREDYFKFSNPNPERIYKVIFHIN
ncbi:SMAD/FHA domain [Pseudocohnilembus persalinus]|uniref:SMAD/FHA domain n=1 Tax=Pseudocohnilembus persalinus TaxID=266149 RepID=A0A0V0QV71_PSEPJ|nr:SMAD/FHA domain [Pseudocohnilembus persalinus]|eukprot:KRX06110.1 SMAD/FHA domain [Pseudocohnilembus persalinus]